jgi:hypothetical protein
MSGAWSRNASLALQRQVEKTAAYTVVVVTDSGKIFSSSLDGIVFTLPSIATGENYGFINIADDGDAALNISPAAADGISYAGTSVDDKDLINTKATQVKGDFSRLASFDGADHWQVPESIGIWAKEA